MQHHVVWKIHTKVLEPVTCSLKMLIPVCCIAQHYIPADRNSDWEHVEWKVYGLGQHVKGGIFLEELRETPRTSVMITCIKRDESRHTTISANITGVHKSHSP